jgi:hypothetical protein
MTAILILLGILFVVAIAAATLRDIHGDGYGRRPAPPSHHDPFEPGLRLRSH